MSKKNLLFFSGKNLEKLDEKYNNNDDPKIYLCFLLHYGK